MDSEVRDQWVLEQMQTLVSTQLTRVHSKVHDVIQFVHKKSQLLRGMKNVYLDWASKLIFRHNNIHS